MSKKYFLEVKIEKILWWSRFLVLIPVLLALFTFILIIIGLFYKVYKLVLEFYLHGFSDKMLAWIISNLDISLLAVVILIFAWWIYELFVDEIDVDDQHKTEAKILMVKDLDELKEKIWKVIIILLIVWLFKQIILNVPKNNLEILYYAIAILFMSISLKVLSIKK